MADSLEIKAPSIGQDINISVHGMDVLKNVIRTLEQLSEGTQLHDYWTTQEELVRRVTSAYKEFNQTASSSSAAELVSNINALKAVAGGDIAGLFKNFEGMQAGIERAVEMVGRSVNGLTTANFKDAFAAFETLKDLGVDTSDLFQRLTTSTDTRALQAAFQSVNEQLVISKRRVRALREELDNLKSSSGIKEKEEEIDNLRATIEDVRTVAEGEFREFLRGHGIEDDGWRFSSYFDDIRDGTQTAVEAIRKFKLEYEYLFEELRNQGVDTSQVDLVIERMEEAIIKVENLASEMRNISSSIRPSDIASALSQSENLTEEQRASMAALAQEGTELKSILPILAELINTTAQAEQNTGSTLNSLTQLVSTIRELGTVSEPALSSMSGIFKSLGKIDKLSVNAASIKNIVNAVKDISSFGNVPNLNIVSNVDFTGFKDLHISKASLRNLAEYLPVIASVNAAKLEKLSHVNLTNFNDVKVSKASLNAIADLSNYQDSLKLLKDTIDQVVTSINSLNKSMNGSGGSGNGEVPFGNASNGGGKSNNDINQLKAAENAVKKYYAALISARKNVRDLRFDSENEAWVSESHTDEIKNLNRLREAYKLYRNDKVMAQLDGTQQYQVLQLENDLANKLAVSTERVSHAEEERARKAAQHRRELEEQSAHQENEAYQTGLHKAEQRAAKEIELEREKYQAELDELEKYERAREAKIEKENDKLFQAHVSAGQNSKWKSQGLTASNIDSLFGKAEKNQDLFKDIDGGFNAVREKYRQLIQLQEQWKAGGSNATAPEVKSITRLRAELKTLIEERLADAEAKKKQDAESKKQTSTEARRQSLLKQMYNLLTRLKKEEENWSAARNGKSSRAYSNLQQYQHSLTELIHTTEAMKTPEGIENIASQFSALSKNAAESEHVIRANGEAVQTWRDRLGGLADKFASWFGITRVIMAAVNAVRKMIASAKEIDSALTQLKIVTNATNEEMEAFANTAIDLAHNLGKSVAELTKSIETFSRLGYSLNDAAELAKYATIMSNVAGVSTEEATTGLTSIIKGYDKDVEDAEHVADILVTVGQKYAVSAAEMMEAYEKSGAALHATNTSLEKSAGLIAAANASVQDASVIGTAIKTVSARIRGKIICASVYSNIHAQAQHAA